MLTLILVTFVYCLCLSILKGDINPTSPNPSLPNPSSPNPPSPFPVQDKVSELLTLIPSLVRASDLKSYNVSTINLLDLLP